MKTCVAFVPMVVMTTTLCAHCRAVLTSRCGWDGACGRCGHALDLASREAVLAYVDEWLEDMTEPLDLHR